MVNVDGMQLGSMHHRRTTDTLYIVRRLQEEYKDKERKLKMHFLDIDKAFDSSKKGDGVDDEEDRFTRISCKSGDESLLWCQDKSLSGIRVS